MVHTKYSQQKLGCKLLAKCGNSDVKMEEKDHFANRKDRNVPFLWAGSILKPSHSPPLALPTPPIFPTMLHIMSDEIIGSICKAVWLQCRGIKADECDFRVGERGEGFERKVSCCVHCQRLKETEILLPKSSQYNLERLAPFCLWQLVDCMRPCTHNLTHTHPHCVWWSSLTKTSPPSAKEQV